MDHPRVMIPDNLLIPMEKRYMNSQFMMIALMAFKQAKQQVNVRTEGRHQTFKKLT